MKTKKIIMAFFDILGTSEKIESGEYQEVYDYYSQMIRLCNDSHTPLAIHNPLYGKKDIFPELNDVMKSLFRFDIPYHIINYDLNHAFFSDTFLLWIEDDEFLNPLLGGFLEKCCIVFCEALKRGIVLRGTISIGEAIMDNDNHIYLGKPLVEAAKSELHQRWIGVSLGHSIMDSIHKIHQMDMSYLLPYKRHLKIENDPLLSDYVLDWFNWWKQKERNDAEYLISKLNTDVTHGVYYENTLSYIEASKQRMDIWNEYMISSDINRLSELCSMGDDIDKELLLLRKQGIEILTSEIVMNHISYLLNRDNPIWYDEINKSTLEVFYNRSVIVEKKIISIDDFIN